MNSQRRPSRGYITVAFALGMPCLAAVTTSAQDVRLAPRPLKHAGTFAPGYSFGAWTTQLPVSYGVWRFEPRAFQDASVSCESGYRISALALSGPAGLTQW